MGHHGKIFQEQRGTHSRKTENKKSTVTLELGVSHSHCGGTEGDSCLCFPVRLLVHFTCFLLVALCTRVDRKFATLAGATRRPCCAVCTLHTSAPRTMRVTITCAIVRGASPGLQATIATSLHSSGAREFNCLLLTEGHRAVAQHQQVWKYEFRK